MNLNNQLKQMVSKMKASCNIPILLKNSNRRLANIFKYSYKIGRLKLIARSDCGKVSFPKQNKTTIWSLACLSYTKSLPISKTNLPRPAMAMNAVAGSSTRSWRSWCRLLHRKRPTCFDVLKRFSELLKLRKSVSTPLWPHPRFPGNDYGKGFGR